MVFYVREDGEKTQLMPLMIQLNQTSGIDPIFMPPSRSIFNTSRSVWENDRRYITWMFARMHV